MNKHQKPVLTGQRFKTRKRGRLWFVALGVYVCVEVSIQIQEEENLNGPCVLLPLGGAGGVRVVTALKRR